MRPLAALIKSDLSQIGINVNIVTQDPVTFGAKNSAGDFDWDLTARGMRGDVDGYVAEFNPVSPTGPTVYQKWFTGWNGAPGGSNPKPIWRLVGNGRITLDTKKRLPMYQKLNQLLIDELVEVPLISVSKFFVVNKRLQEHLRRVHRLQPGAAHGVRRLLANDPNGGPGTSPARRSHFRIPCIASSPADS